MKYKCPYCKKPFDKLRAGGGKEKNPFWPFCSERCRLIDLGKWASGQYSIPGDPVSKEKEDEEEREDKENVD